MNDGFVQALEATARVLAPFVDPPSSGGRRWDGAAYVSAPESPFDPGAAKWWSALTALAGIIAARDGPLSAKQKEFLERTLFGGMGSLNDLAIDEGRVGADASRANEELDRARGELFAELRRTG
jgi:hypothetical protein